MYMCILQLLLAQAIAPVHWTLQIMPGPGSNQSQNYPFGPGMGYPAGPANQGNAWDPMENLRMWYPAPAYPAPAEAPAAAPAFAHCAPPGPPPGAPPADAIQAPAGPPPRPPLDLQDVLGPGQQQQPPPPEPAQQWVPAQRPAPKAPPGPAPPGPAQAFLAPEVQACADDRSIGQEPRQDPARRSRWPRNNRPWGKGKGPDLDMPIFPGDDEDKGKESKEGVNTGG